MADPFVNLQHQRFGENSPRNSRLVRYYDHGELRSVQPGNRRGPEWKYVEPADVIQITHLLANCAVPIEENRGLEDLLLRQDLGSKCSRFLRDRLPRGTCAPLQTPGPQRSASYIDGRWDIYAENTGCIPPAPAIT